MTVPKALRDSLKDLLWKEANKLDWVNLSPIDKSRYYELWTETSEIGGKISDYLDARKVRVYIKDTLLKDYARERLADPAQIYRVLGIEPNIRVIEEYIKPHGRRLLDGRVIAWSRASEWKLTLLAIFERASENKFFFPYAAVLLQSSPIYSTGSHPRLVVEDAARKLGLKHVIWLD